MVKKNRRTPMFLRQYSTKVQDLYKKGTAHLTAKEKNQMHAMGYDTKYARYLSVIFDPKEGVASDSKKFESTYADFVKTVKEHEDVIRSKNPDEKNVTSLALHYTIEDAAPLTNNQVSQFAQVIWLAYMDKHHLDAEDMADPKTTKTISFETYHRVSRDKSAKIELSISFTTLEELDMKLRGYQKNDIGAMLGELGYTHKDINTFFGITFSY